MARKTLTRQDISEALFRHVGLSKNESAYMLETVLDQISNALIDGKSVKLSSFGTKSKNGCSSYYKCSASNKLQTLQIDERAD